MHFTNAFLLLPPLLGCVTALPTPEFHSQPSSRSFKVNVDRPDPWSSAAIERRSNGVASTQNIANTIWWTANATIGGQQMRLLIDTGSADLWLMGSELPEQDNNPHNYYNATASRTFSLLEGEKFNISYGDGAFGASGPVGTDTVNIGGAVVPNMPIGVADVVGKVWLDQAYDGFLGLSFQHANSIRPNNQGTFMENVQSSLNEPVFTCNFRAGTTGTLEFGYIDNTLYTGSLTEISVNNQTEGSWTVENVSFSTGATPISASPQSMLFDTGGITTLAHPSVVAAYWAQVPGSEDLSNGNGTSWAFPCASPLPDLSLSFPPPSASPTTSPHRPHPGPVPQRRPRRLRRHHVQRRARQRPRRRRHRRRRVFQSPVRGVQPGRAERGVCAA